MKSEDLTNEAHWCCLVFIYLKKYSPSALYLIHSGPENTSRVRQALVLLKLFSFPSSGSHLFTSPRLQPPVVGREIDCWAFQSRESLKYAVKWRESLRGNGFRLAVKWVKKLTDGTRFFLLNKEIRLNRTSVERFSLLKKYLST